MELIDAREPDAQTLEASERRFMGAELGLHEDDAALAELHAAGIRPSTLALLDVLPLLELVWADGRVTPRERQIVAAAAARRVGVNGSAHSQLAIWLSERPTDGIFDAGRRTLRQVAGALPRTAVHRLRATLETEIALLVSPSNGLLAVTTAAAGEESGIVQRLLGDLGLRDTFEVT
jgi:hypothetical protein